MNADARRIFRATVPMAALLVAGIVAAQSPNPPVAATPPATKQAAPKAKPAKKTTRAGFKRVPRRWSRLRMPG